MCASLSDKRISCAAARTMLAAAVVAGLGVLAQSASAATIGIQFAGASNSLATNNDTAGVVPQANWNSKTANAASGVSGLIDSDGATVTGLSLTYTSNSNVGGVVGGTPTGFQELYSNHLESPYAAAPAPAGVEGNRVTVYLTNIPYAAYDLYVYTPNEGRPLTIYQGTSNATVGATSFAVSDSRQTNYVLNDNYVVFLGLTGSTQYLVASNATNSGGGNFNSGIAGIQVVEAVPEPATLGLLAAGSLLLLGRRRRSAGRA